jgi:hypothetical protein
VARWVFSSSGATMCGRAASWTKSSGPIILPANTGSRGRGARRPPSSRETRARMTWRMPSFSLSVVANCWVKRHCSPKFLQLQCKTLVRHRSVIPTNTSHAPPKQPEGQRIKTDQDQSAELQGFSSSCAEAMSGSRRRLSMSVVHIYPLWGEQQRSWGGIAGLMWRSCAWSWRLLSGKRRSGSKVEARDRERRGIQPLQVPQVDPWQKLEPRGYMIKWIRSYPGASLILSRWITTSCKHLLHHQVSAPRTTPLESIHQAYEKRNERVR